MDKLAERKKRKTGSKDKVFPPGFIWGAAASAYQIEGAHNEDGKGESVWDLYCNQLKIAANGETGNVAADHYHRYRDDVKIMKDLGLKAYRFSIAWTRILPAGIGAKNQKGIDFYNNLISELLAAGIEPIPTLYHWDFPRARSDSGGWSNRASIDWFAEYAGVCFNAFGDRVKHWITLNEPWVDSYAAAYWLGKPSAESLARSTVVAHHQMLAQAKAIAVYRSSGQKGKIGVTLSLSPAYPATASAADKEAALRFDGFFNRWFLDPALKGEYPEDMVKLYQEKLQAPEIKSNDLDLLKNNLANFLGVNYYSRNVIRAASEAPVLGLAQVENRDPTWAYNGEVYPQGLYDLLLRLDRDYNHPEIIITENGAGFEGEDRIEDGRVHDRKRQDYLKRHIEAVVQALAKGVKIRGYLVWSVFDNFEWIFGFGRRFGIVYVDFKSQQRIWKDSANWYKGVIANNGLEK